MRVALCVCVWGGGGCGGLAVETEANHTPLPAVEFKNMWNFIPAPVCIFMLWCWERGYLCCNLERERAQIFYLFQRVDSVIYWFETFVSQST